MSVIEVPVTEYQQLQTEIISLRQQVEWLRKMLFGNGKSERMDAAQLRLQLDVLEKEIEVATQKVSYERKKPKVGKHEPPAERFKHLPVQETVVIEPEEVKADPDAFERIGAEETFEVDIQPPKLFKRVIIRPKYRHKTDRTQPPVLAPAPKRPIEGGYASAGLIAWIVLQKYVQHMPLYRQEKASAMWGAVLSRKTMNDWVETVADWLKPIYNYIKKNLQEGGYVQADETLVRYLDPDVKKGKAEQGWLWAISRPGSDVIFSWRLTRCHAELKSLLGDYTGLLQSDAYGAYEAYAHKQGVIPLGCMTHARRKFYDTLENNPREAGLVLKLIGKLYACEQTYRDENLSNDERLLRRQIEQPTTLNRLRKVIGICAAQALPKSALGKACHYALKEWGKLTTYLNHGNAEIDNNLMENAIRPSAVGKKNFLFIGHPNAGERSAIIYSIVISCQRHKIDPLAYLKDVLSRLPTMTNQNDIATLTPAQWSQTSIRNTTQF